MDNFSMVILFGAGMFAGFFCGTYLSVHYHNKLVKKRLDQFIQNLDVLFGDLVVGIDQTIQQGIRPRKTTRVPDSAKNDLPPPHIMEKLEKMGSISNEISDLVMTLDGPLKGGLDAKYRKANAAKIRALQDEMKEVIDEILRLGFDPKIMFMDQYGNKQITTLSKLKDRMANGPDDLKPFSDDKPNLSIVEEKGEEVPPDTNIH